ncbi:MAG: HEPN domain-containing protein [Bacteroidota bacterium]
MTGTKDDYITYRIEKSNEVFEDAVLLAKNERWNSSVNRLYYSVYYLASALLYKNNIQAKTHNGVKTQLFLSYVKTNKINRKYGLLYSHLFDWRQETDYADFVDFDEETVKPIILEVQELRKVLDKLI